MRPTLKDLARESGVSLATIDRVLNGRSGVRDDTVSHVQETIERIGYVRNMQAANLARRQTYAFQFILPDSGGAFIDGLVDEIDRSNHAFSAEMTSAAAAFVDANDPHAVTHFLTRLDPGDVQGVAIMVPDAPQIRDAMARLVERGIKVVRFLTGQSQAAATDFVGTDNRVAGATAAAILGRFIGGDEGKVLIVSETMRSRDAIQRRLGFDTVMQTEFPGFTVLPSVETYGSRSRACKVLAQSLANHADLRGAYFLSSEVQPSFEAFAEVADCSSLRIVAHERTAFTEAAIRADRIDALIDQHAGHAVRSAIRILRARCENREPSVSQETIRTEILMKQNL